MKSYRRLFYATYRLIRRLDGEDATAPLGAALVLSLCLLMNLATLASIFADQTGVDRGFGISRVAGIAALAVAAIVHYRLLGTADRLAALQEEFPDLHARRGEAMLACGYPLLSLLLFVIVV